MSKLGSEGDDQTKFIICIIFREKKSLQRLFGMFVDIVRLIVALVTFRKIEELFRVISRKIDSLLIVIEMQNYTDRWMLCVIFSGNSSA